MENDLQARLAELEEKIRQAEAARERAEAAREQAEAARGQAEAARGQAEAARGQAEAARGQAEAARGQAEAARGQAEAARDCAENPLAPSTFLNFIRNAEDTLYSSFYARPDSPKSSSDSTTRVDGKFYPLFLRPWTDFATDHAATFNDLATAFADHAIFPSPSDVEAIRSFLYPDIIIADKTDLGQFVDVAIERPAAFVLAKYMDRVRPYEHVASVRFRGSAYGPKNKEEEAERDGGRPDRWGFAVHTDRKQTSIFVGEYKTAHKLTAKTLRRVMSAPPPENFFTQAIQSGPGEATDVADSVLVARVLCEAYHHMVSTGHEFGYVASGDGLVFLRVLENDCRTLYYSWAVFPVAAIEDRAARRAANMGARTPQETAMAHVASFCLWAAQTTPRPSSWIDQAEECVNRWPELYDEVVLPAAWHPGGTNDGDGDGGDQGDSWPSGSYPRLPALFRSGPLKRRRSPGGSGPAGGSANRTAVARGTWARIMVRPPTLPYCTQACLRGLSQNLPLDPKCPNVERHRSFRASQEGVADNHPLTAEAARSLVVAQLSSNMDKGCECLIKHGMFGRIGVLFKITIPVCGYTMLAKGVQAVHRDDLAKEAAVYRALTDFQGRLVPVCLGLVNLERPIPLNTGARVWQMMLLSYAGRNLCSTKALPADVDFEAETDRTAAELEAAGLYNDDVREANLAWNEEAGRVMQLDFDQAEMLPVAEQAAAPPTTQAEDGAKTSADRGVGSPREGLVRSPLFEKRDFNAHVAGGQNGSD